MYIIVYIWVNFRKMRDTTLQRYQEVVECYNQKFEEYKEKHGIEHISKFKNEIFRDVADETHYSERAVKNIYYKYLRKEW